MSYGIKSDRTYTAAPVFYVGRILKGEKPTDLPVQSAHQVRAGHQPQDRQGARPRNSADAARPRRRGDRMKRREFITLLGGAAARGRSRRGRSSRRCRRIGVLMHGRGSTGMTGRASWRLPRRGLQELGWAEGRNVRIEYRWADRRCRRLPALRGRIWSRSRRSPHAASTAQPSGRGGKGSDPHRCRSCSSMRHRPGRRRLRRQPRRGRAAMPPVLHVFEYGIEREMAGAAQVRVGPRVTRVAVLRQSRHLAGSRSIRRDRRAAAPSLGVELRSRSTCATR